jgi:hypothetical protein
MAKNIRSFGFFALVAAAALAMTTGCDGDDEDDDCRSCCLCKNDNSPLEYTPDASGDCLTCREQCDELARRDFANQKFDIAQKIECDE